MNQWTNDEAAEVIEVIMRRWPGGVANKGWDLKVLEGYVGEMQQDNLTPHWAIVGLRACESAFIPSVGQVRTLARAAMPPLTAYDIEQIAERQREQRREAQRQLEA